MFKIIEQVLLAGLQCFMKLAGSHSVLAVVMQKCLITRNHGGKLALLAIDLLLSCWWLTQHLLHLMWEVGDPMDMLIYLYE